MAQLGPLEREVMDVLWAARSPLPVRGVLTALAADPDRPVRAYTTVQTVADRLVGKGELARTQEGRSWAYTPTADRAAHAAAQIVAVLDATPDRAGALRSLIATLGRRDQRVLREALPPAPAPRKRA